MSDTRLALVTGATGYVGGHVVGELLSQGWAVRTLSRSRTKAEAMEWGERIVPAGTTAGGGEVEVFEGDADSRNDIARALDSVDVAYYLLHSMSEGDFVVEDREMATRFAEEARKANIDRIVYLGGLHPAGEELSDHLRSRVEVGDILLGSGIPTAALQAGVVIGNGSASFSMLRHLSERLPGAIGPKWITNHITPIAVDDAVFYLTRAADLGPEHNRTFDIGGPEDLSYSDMMKRYARVLKIGPRPVFTAPVTTPGLASRWISLVTPIETALAKPLVGSLVHETVVKERDLEALVGTPLGGPTPFDDAVRLATTNLDPTRWYRIAAGVAGAVAATAVAGSAFTDPHSRWYRRVKKPSFQPPAAVFSLVWTALYADLWAMSALVIGDKVEEDDEEGLRSYATALGTNLVLNAGWCGVFFRGHRPWLSAAWSVALTVSTGDLVRRTWANRRERGVLLAPYAVWTGFATLLSTAIARKN